MVADTSNPLQSKEVEHFPVSRLHFDADNPRLGALGADLTDERTILNTMVDRFGIDDVLSSIAVNGYFESEPLVGVRQGEGNITVLEGNRRLAACLILTGDGRAEGQSKRASVFRGIMDAHGRTIGDLPVLVYDEERDREKLLPYLGVRHIAGAQPWDSYAKAAWVASVLEKNELSLADVSRMVGDEHRTVARIVDGYYFVKQLVSEGCFDPGESLRPGKGSNPEFPFSWVYTALGFTQIRKWLGLGDVSELKKNPVPQDRLDNAEQLMKFLFGHRTAGLNSVVRESREIASLAKCVNDRERLRYLEQGKSVREVEELTKPSGERATNGVLGARDELEAVFALLGKGEVSREEASSLVKFAQQVFTLAESVLRKLKELARP